MKSLKSYLYFISNMKIFFVVPFNCVIVAQWHYRYRSYCLLYSSPLYCFFNSWGCMYKMQDGGLTLCSGGHTKSSQQIFPQRWRIQDGGLTSCSVLEDIRNPLIKYSHWDGETKMAALPRVLEDIGTKFSHQIFTLRWRIQDGGLTSCSVLEDIRNPPTKYSHWDGEFKMAALPRVSPSRVATPRSCAAFSSPAQRRDHSPQNPPVGQNHTVCNVDCRQYKIRLSHKQRSTGKCAEKSKH